MLGVIVIVGVLLAVTEAVALEVDVGVAVKLIEGVPVDVSLAV